jgi:hypothetical protein
MGLSWRADYGSHGGGADWKEESLDRNFEIVLLLISSL